MSEDPYEIRVTEIGEYIRHGSCPRRFKLGTNDELATEPPFAEELFNPMDPILQKKGRQRENKWEDLLREGGMENIGPAVSPDDDTDFSWEEFSEAVSSLNPGQQAFAREVEIEEIDLNAFSMNGRIDFLLVLWEDDNPYLRIVETKASRKDKTYHRIQVATYALLIENLLADTPLEVGESTIGHTDIEAIVGRIDEDTEEVEDILEMDAFDLTQERADILELTKESGGNLKSIVERDLDDLQYQLDSKCDSCRFDVHCFPESARKGKLEILGLNTSETRVLRDEDINKVDQLAELDPDGPKASQIRSKQTFDSDLETLIETAQARRQNLPGDTPDDEYEVTPLSHNSESQLPDHDINNQNLIRVYLNVDYDYTENRVGSLAAHVTTSDGELLTKFQNDGGVWSPDPDVVEDLNGTERDVQGGYVIETVADKWTGNYDVDTGFERSLLSSFFRSLQAELERVSESESAPIHFYVWSESEMGNLVEACARAGGNSLAKLRQFLGCREPTEQLIYSTLQNEVHSRFALGWTGQGLVVATGIRWFGQSFHWTRKPNDETVDLTDKFLQNLFDFRRNLHLDSEGEWSTEDADDSREELFEIRSRFFDSLPAPYWRADWRDLRDPSDVPEDKWRLRQALRRYHRSEGYLDEYLKTRTQALRWIDEQIRFKNSDIDKPDLEIGELLNYSLDVGGAGDAALNFLDIDFHSKLTEWLSYSMQPPIKRVPSGDTIPIKSVRTGPDGKIRAQLNLEPHDISEVAFKKRTSYSGGSYVRLSPCFEDQRRGQTQAQLRRGGYTCKVESINWNSQTIKLDPLTTGESRKFTLASYYPGRNESLFEYATVDESISDFTGRRVHNTISENKGNHVHDWFDPEDLAVPPLEDGFECDVEELKEILEGFELDNGASLRPSQIEAIIEGVQSRVHLLHGPPGTGKTTTTAVATLLRILGPISEGEIALVGGSTHTAVSTLIEKIDSFSEEFKDICEENGVEIPEIETVRINDREETSVSEGIHTIKSKSSVNELDDIRDDAVVFVGGSVSELLKLDERVLSGSATFGGDEREYSTPMLIVDEASMMTFPHFLALSGMIDEENGMLLLAGDHRQLPPILSHDWEDEDRPPVEKYQPHASAFEAVRQMDQDQRVDKHSVNMTALEYSFRLPEVLRKLVGSVYEDELRGDDTETGDDGRSSDDPVGQIWDQAEGLYLLVHDESQSRKSNPLETDIVNEIIDSADDLDDNSVAIMTPHRAQQTLLDELVSTSRYESIVDTVDTVERMQGGECENVIVSATGSDQTAISDNEEFLLNLNRTNVAFSRAEKRLIVVCSQNLLNHIAPEYEDYKSSTLWKSLRELCNDKIGEIEFDETTVQVYEHLDD